MYENDHILTMVQAADLATKLHEKNISIATTNGCFDLLHPGHCTLLQKTHECGEVSIVGINSDSSVKAAKGDTRPVRSQQERAELLLALLWVDYVVIYDQKTSIPFVETIRPRYHINDSLYGKDCIEREPVEAQGGEIVVVGLVRCRSTTDMINDILSRHGCR